MLVSQDFRQSGMAWYGISRTQAEAVAENPESIVHVATGVGGVPEISIARAGSVLLILQYQDDGTPIATDGFRLPADVLTPGGDAVAHFRRLCDAYGFDVRFGDLIGRPIFDATIARPASGYVRTGVKARPGSEVHQMTFAKPDELVPGTIRAALVYAIDVHRLRRRLAAN